LIDSPVISDIPSTNHNTCHAGSRRLRSVVVPVASNPSSSQFSSSHFASPPTFSSGICSNMIATSLMSVIPAR
jgi:hypothetical protein